MAWINTRGTRLSQPQGPVEVDWGNPLARGLRRAINFNTLRPREVVENTPITYGWNYPLGPVHISTVGAGNRAYKLPWNNGQGIHFAGWQTTGEASFVVLQHRVVSIDNNDWMLTGTGGDGQHFPWNGNAAGGHFWNTRWFEAPPPGGASFLRPSVIAVSVKNGSQRAFWDGRVFASATQAGAAVVRSTISVISDGYADVAIYLCYMWSRALTDTEIASISANPWQLFKPVTRRVYFDVGGSSGPSQSLAFTLEDLTSSISQTLSHSQSAAFTLDGITPSISQTLGHGQTLGVTLDDITANIAQEIAGAKAQSIAITLDDVTASVSQTANHPQSLAATLDDVAVSISQSSASPNKDQSIAITLDDLVVDIKQVSPRRKQAGGRRNYIIKGKRYHLNDYELRVMIQEMIDEVERKDIEVEDGEMVKKVSRRVWSQLKQSNAQLDFTLKELQSKVAIDEIDDEDDIALLML